MIGIHVCILCNLLLSDRLLGLSSDGEIPSPVVLKHTGIFIKNRFTRRH